MKNKQKKPPFPVLYFGEVNAFTYAGSIVVPRLVTRIPLYTLQEDPTKRLKMEAQYNEEQKKEYEEAVKFYEGINIGDVYWDGKNRRHTVRISKLSISKDVLFVNLCATKDHKEYAAEKGFKPIKSIKWQFEVFQSLVKSKTLLKFEDETEK